MKFFLYLISYLFYPFSFLFIRRKRKVAFGSFKNAFNDNAKYLYIYFRQHRPELDSVWLSWSKETVNEINALGLKAYYTLSPRGIWHALTSKYWFFNSYTSDIMFAFSGGATCVNLWHGVGLKRIEFNIHEGVLAERYQKKNLKQVFFHPESFRRPDWLLTSTPFQTKMFASAFRIPEERCLEFGYPRNEILTLPREQCLDFVERFEPESTLRLITDIQEDGYKKVFIYMPTWRDSQRDLFVQSFDLERMNALLQTQHSLLLLKPHANMMINASAFSHYSNIFLLDAKTDVYPVLPFTEVLITDYSSILYDYILMKDKDVILYLYDYEEYIKNRDFFYPFDENVVGKRIYDFGSLCDCIEALDFKMEETAREAIIDRFWGVTAGMSPNTSLLTWFTKV